MIEILNERMELCRERLSQIKEKAEIAGTFGEYFEKVASFILELDEMYNFVKAGKLETASIEELADKNKSLYRDIMPGAYEESYANPQYAVSKLGDEQGCLLSAVYTEIREGIVPVHAGDLYNLVIRAELFLEIYSTFCCAKEDGNSVPEAEQIREILYYYVNDYSEDDSDSRIAAMVGEDGNRACDIVMDSDLSSTRYLYKYGYYVGENELEFSKFMASLSDEELRACADTYTEGYRIGFEMTGKDLSKKTIADVRYPLGIERMVRRSIENFSKMGLKSIIRVTHRSLLSGRGLNLIGCFFLEPNRQYVFDHREDLALVLDKNLVNRRLECIQNAFENYKEAARGYAGPAVIESFGEENFEPVNKKEAASYSAAQNKLLVDMSTRNGQIQRQYIIEEERSFTIIAFPIPEIRKAISVDGTDRYGEFFKEIIKVNTLDYVQYRDIQACIIEALNKADYCLIKGMNGNKTDLKINLYKLKDPSKEAIFENCVADVNIPVGEVFTSPVLEGTNGILHVSRVYLNGLEFKNLEIEFTEGKISRYNCSNFENPEDNKKLIDENILFRHETLPIGEFAIGTNTTAYVLSRKYGVQSMLPILIAEKTGPHFAVGDTCYSHAEDIKVYNPDGREIVAKDNSCSLMRDTDMSKAYFNCHTDITIPYEELGSLVAVSTGGEQIPILENGRFVLAGSEALNIPLDEA